MAQDTFALVTMVSSLTVLSGSNLTSVLGVEVVMVGGMPVSVDGNQLPPKWALWDTAVLRRPSSSEK